MLPAAIAPAVLTTVLPALAPLAKELVSGYTNAVAKREEERTRRAAIEGETKCRVTAIETSGKLFESEIEGQYALDMQCCQDVGGLLHQPEVVNDPQKLTQVLDALKQQQDSQYAQSRDRLDRISGGLR